MTVRIYRVQNDDGVGMYQSRAWNFVTNLDDSPSRDWPMPGEDSVLCAAGYSPNNWNRHHRFGFASVQQLRSWIYRDEWIHSFNELEFHLAIFDAPDDKAFVGSTQVVFDVTAAVEHERRSLLSLL